MGTAIGTEGNRLVHGFVLNQNYPNPFNPTTQISYRIAKTGNYELAVFNILGKKIRTLQSAKLKPGNYSLEWDARNDLGAKVASGIYFYQLSGKNVQLTQKMILMQ